MRLLFYFVDAHRYCDYVEGNPYRDKLVELGLKKYDKYYTQYPTTYRWILTTFNATDDISSYNYDIAKSAFKGTEYLNNYPFEIKRLAKQLNLTTRIHQIESKHNRNDLATFRGIFDEEINKDTLLNIKDNVLDFVYDTVAHDIIFATDPPPKSKILKLYNKAYNEAEQVLSKEFIDSYDRVLIVSDHGFLDNDDFKGSKAVKTTGNPNTHGHCILWTNFDLLNTNITNMQLLPILFNTDSRRVNDNIVVNSYTVFDVGGVRAYWYYYNNEWYYLDVEYLMIQLDNYESPKILKLVGTEVEEVDMPEDLLDSLYLDSPNFRKIYDFSIEF